MCKSNAERNIDATLVGGISQISRPHDRTSQETRRPTLSQMPMMVTSSQASRYLVEKIADMLMYADLWAVVTTIAAVAIRDGEDLPLVAGPVTI
jgi:hypothetical protein